MIIKNIFLRIINIYKNIKIEILNFIDKDIKFHIDIINAMIKIKWI